MPPSSPIVMLPRSGVTPFLRLLLGSFTSKARTLFGSGGAGGAGRAAGRRASSGRAIFPAGGRFDFMTVLRNKGGTVLGVGKERRREKRVFRFAPYRPGRV